MKVNLKKKTSLRKILVWGLLTIDVLLVLVSTAGIGRGVQRYFQLKQEPRTVYQAEVNLSSIMAKHRKEQRLNALGGSKAQIASFTLFAIFMIIVSILTWLAISGQLSPLLSKVVLIANSLLVGVLAFLVILVLVFLEMALRGWVSL